MKLIVRYVLFSFVTRFAAMAMLYLEAMPETVPLLVPVTIPFTASFGWLVLSAGRESSDNREKPLDFCLLGLDCLG